MDNIITSSPDSLSALISNCYHHFIRDLNLAVRLTFDVWEARFEVCDLANAQKRGSVCMDFVVHFKNDQRDDSTGLNRMMRWLDTFGTGGAALKNALDACMALGWVQSEFGTGSISLSAEVVVRRTERPALRVYSPFAVIAPLKALPAKWTVSHVVRALWNGQFTGLKCTGKYSDDFKFDAATNFGMERILDGRVFAKRLIESPRGWWASGGINSVSISCGGFDYNEFSPCLAVQTVTTTPEPSLAVA